MHFFSKSVASKKQQIPNFHLILQVETIGEEEKQFDRFFLYQQQISAKSSSKSGVVGV